MTSQSLHYHVGANTPGYLPEGDVVTHGSKRAAQAAMAANVREYRDQEADYLPRSQRRVSVSGSAKCGFQHFQRPNAQYDLGLSFWWNRCADPACDDDAE